MDRRSFLKLTTAAGAGLVIGVPAFGKTAGGAAASHDFGAFVQIGTDNLVTIWVTKSDMGQDVRTSLPMIVAEELDADWNNVRVRQAYLDPKFGRMGTGGSGSVRSLWTPLREAGAMARAMLVGAAAARWKVDGAEIQVANGIVSHGTRKATFGELAEEAAKIRIEGKPALKDPKNFKIIGKAQKRLDAGDIVTGKAAYGIDGKVPGMLYAAVLRSPAFGGKIASIDDTKAKAVAGVKQIVKIEALGKDLPWNGVAVVATSTWAAMKGRDALAVTWDEGALAAESTETLRKQLAEKIDSGTSVHERGDVAAALAKGTTRIDADYEVPFLAHAAMEPLNAIAHVKKDGAEIWAGTQAPDWAANSSAAWLGFKPEQVKVNVTILGGGFGRRSKPDFVLEAVQLSKAAGAPVKVQWTREDDMKHDYYRPQSLHRISATLDAGKNISAWHHRIAAPSVITFMEPHTKTPALSEIGGVEDMPYDVPNFRADFALATSGVPRGWWRSVEDSTNGFVMNAFLDELAHAAGRDPVELRLALLPKGFVQKFPEGARPHPWPYQSDRFRAVIELAREKSGWGKPVAAGRALGFAAHYSFLTYVAQVAEVSMGEDGMPKVHRIVCVMDCGTVVNPEGVRVQIEGSVVYGLSAALAQKITIENGRVQQANFHDFPVMIMNQMPAVDVYLMPSGEPPTGAGEPGLPPLAAAVTNAMFKLTGKRVRTLPLV